MNRPKLTDQQRQALLSLLQRLIATPSVNGQHPEVEVAQLAAIFASQHGLEAALFEAELDRPNLIVRSGAEPPGLLLVAHLDTVAPGDPHHWQYPPLSATLADGRIYGRGAIDNKGGLVAALGALLLAQTYDPLLPIMLVGVPDEESGATGRLGISFLHQKGLLAGRGAIYTYPGNDQIVIGHRGLLRLKITAYGRALHTGSLEWQNATGGLNAISGLMAILQQIEALQLTAPKDASLFAPYRTVITATQIQGGSGPSMVPDQAEAIVDIRLVPAMPQSDVEAAIYRIVEDVTQQRKPLRIQIERVAELPHTVIAADEPIVQAVQQASQTILHHTPPLTVSGPANESYLLNQLGIPTCIIGPTGSHAHAADEYIDVESLFQIMDLYAEVGRLMGK
jgi:acetylornithine deacetylase/succinyl-diaminopimelate desuccinylase-like protein